MADEVEVTFNPGFGGTSTSNKRTCLACGMELDDARKRYHDECKPEPVRSAPKTGGRVRSKGKGKAPTEAVSRGMNSIVGKLLYLLTLFIAWSMLRGIGVADPTGDMADACALTDDEATLIGRPLTRLFLSTEQGRRVAPSLVDNEDLIDAAFALWDWARRLQSNIDQLRSDTIPATREEPPPPVRIRERRNTNGNAGSVTEDRSEVETAVDGSGRTVGYVPPSPIDILGA